MTKGLIEVDVYLAPWGGRAAEKEAAKAESASELRADARHRCHLTYISVSTM